MRDEDTALAGAAPGVLDLEDFVPYRMSVTTNRISRTLAEIYEAEFGLSILRVQRTAPVLLDDDALLATVSWNDRATDDVLAGVARARRALVRSPIGLFPVGSPSANRSAVAR